ncbi:MAG: hypothetical protein ACYTFZ_06755 [Planctomycetota bacterium]
MGRPAVVTVSGAYSGVGKTRLIEQLLPLVRPAAAVKVHCEDRVPAVKREEAPGENAGKDTARYLAAGAERAFLLVGRRSDVLALGRELLEEVGSETVIFETDSLARALAPDIAFFVAGPGQWKPDAEERRRAADIVVTNTAQDASAADNAPGSIQ